MSKKQERPAGVQEKGQEIKSIEQAEQWWLKRIYNKITSQLKNRRDRIFTARALTFSKAIPDSLVILGDTKKDKIIMAYGKEFMVADIKSKFLHLNQKILYKVINKDYSGLTDEQIKDTKIEFGRVIINLLANFIENVVNKKVEIKTNKKD